MLTALARKKKREAVSFEDSLCKSLGWFFPLMAKCGVVSLEELVFRKFPYACPYCRQCPHEDLDCKTTRGTSAVDHKALREKAEANKDLRPQGLNEWQKMFQKIYNRDISERSRSAIGLMEELGELAEAIRVFERHPRFLAGEAADVFSYIMGLANEFALQKKLETQEEFDFESEFLRRYPGLCLACGNQLCTCPSVPPATIGRMAKELKIGEHENLFSSHFGYDDGADLSQEVLQSVGGFDSIVSRLPLDKGQMSNSVVILCYQLAEAISDFNPALALELRRNAREVADNQTGAGEKHSHAPTQGVVAALSKALKIAVENKASIGAGETENLALSLVKSASRLRVLLVGASPVGEIRLNVRKELAKIKESVEQSRKKSLIEVDEIEDCTIDQLRRKLLDKPYDILHFLGHGYDGGVVLVGAAGEPQEVGVESLRDFLAHFKAVKTVIFNSCETLKGVNVPISQHTIGMADSVNDEHAISFATAFYDALCVDKSVADAVELAKSSVKVTHSGADLPIKLLTAESK